MPDTITAPVFDAKNRLRALIAEVAKGAEVVITNRGTPAARLVPADDAAARERRERARRAAEGIKEVSKGLTLGGLTIRELRDGGRR